MKACFIGVFVWLFTTPFYAAAETWNYLAPGNAEERAAGIHSIYARVGPVFNVIRYSAADQQWKVSFSLTVDGVTIDPNGAFSGFFIRTRPIEGAVADASDHSVKRDLQVLSEAGYGVIEATLLRSEIEILRKGFGLGTEYHLINRGYRTWVFDGQGFEAAFQTLASAAGLNMSLDPRIATIEQFELTPYNCLPKSPVARLPLIWDPLDIEDNTRRIDSMFIQPTNTLMAGMRQCQNRVARQNLKNFHELVEATGGTLVSNATGQVTYQHADAAIRALLEEKRRALNAAGSAFSEAANAWVAVQNKRVEDWEISLHKAAQRKIENEAETQRLERRAAKVREAFATWRLSDTCGALRRVDAGASDGAVSATNRHNQNWSGCLRRVYQFELEALKDMVDMAGGRWAWVDRSQKAYRITMPDWCTGCLDMAHAIRDEVNERQRLRLEALDRFNAWAAARNSKQELWNDLNDAWTRGQREMQRLEAQRRQLWQSQGYVTPGYY